MKGRLFAIVLALLVMLPSGLADVEVKSLGSCSVAPGSYSIEVSNNANSPDKFRITSLGQRRGWIIFDKTSISVPARSTGSFSIVSEPPRTADPGTYNIPIRVTQDGNSSFVFDTEVCVFVRDIRQISFTEASLDKHMVIPGDEVSFDITLTNSGTEELVDVVLTHDVQGPSEILLRKRTFDLERGESVEFSEEIEIIPEMRPGNYTIFTELKKDSRIVGSNVLTFMIEEKENLVVNERGIWTPFADFRWVKFENLGNLPAENSTSYTVTRPMNALISVNGEPEITEGANEVTYTWNSALSPGEKESFSYRINYWPVLLILGALGYGGYRTFIMLRRPSIKKVLLNSRRLNDHMQEFTVALEIKNRTPNNIKTVQIRDFVPNIAKVVKDFGSLVPKTKVSNGTELVWTIKDFRKDDTRMIRYRIVTTVGAVDKFKLGKAVMAGKIDDREFRVHSNELGVGSDKDQ